MLGHWHRHWHWHWHWPVFSPLSPIHFFMCGRGRVSEGVRQRVYYSPHLPCSGMHLRAGVHTLVQTLYSPHNLIISFYYMHFVYRIYLCHI